MFGVIGLPMLFAQFIQVVGSCPGGFVDENLCIEGLGPLGTQSAVTLAFSVAVQEEFSAGWPQEVAEAEVREVSSSILQRGDLDVNQEGRLIRNSDDPCCLHLELARYVIGGPLAFAEDRNVQYPNSTLLCDELQMLEETLWVAGTVRIGMTSLQGAFCDRVNGRGIIARADELFETPTWAHELAHGLGVPHRSDDENALMYAPEGNAGYSGNETYQNLNCSECDCMRRPSINNSINVEVMGEKCGDAGVGSAVEEADQGCSFHVYRSSSGSPAILFVLIAFLRRHSWVRKSRGPTGGGIS